MTVEQLDKQNFQEKISQGVVVVDFFASWCGPCQMMAPVFEELSNEMDVKFAKVSTEQEPEIAQSYAIMSIPCFIIFKDGKEVSRIIGGMPKDALKQKIQEVL